MVIDCDVVVLQLERRVDRSLLSVALEDEEDFPFPRIRDGFVGALFEPGDNMIVNAFYINETYGELV